MTLEGGAPATVDFGVSRVAAGMVLVPGTCGLSVPRDAVGEPTVCARAEDGC